jgi:pimeloyl-ACP methyl ester carboxylesterase
MKMKFRQRLAIHYYKTKINTIGLVSPQKAAALAFDLFSTPFKSRAKKIEPAIFHKAIPLTLKLNQLNVRGYQWKSPQPTPRKMLIIHGFGSDVFKFDKYVEALLKEKFEVFAFNAPGHGNSDGKRINALLYRDMILAVIKQFGPFYGVIAHSLGGLATSLAMEKINNDQPAKVVLIAPATETKTAVEHFFQFLKVDQKIKTAFYELIESLSKETIGYFSVARVIRNADFNTLWVHDEEDKICSFDDVKPVLREQLPKLELFITKGLGHNKIYKMDSTRDKIVHFLATGF